ncbi:hypothetical protein LZ31DRAFT_75 [Colletotrichum somersetense]|nr:hypothetical protein LZ31DRAFT_75 [Colletotrichum somersetense]
MSANYANPGISNASNPSNFGYHHGPIPNPNHGWVPSDVQELHDAGRAYTVTTEMNAAAPNQGNRLSSINTGVCDIIVNPDTNTMCGTVIASQPALRRHIRSAHPGALINPTRTNTSISEESVGKQAIQNWVRSGGWRNADYVREPVAGPAGGLIETYADAMEELAQNDANFAATYGTHFHRPVST